MEFVAGVVVGVVAVFVLVHFFGEKAIAFLEDKIARLEDTETPPEGGAGSGKPDDVPPEAK